eukprot:28030_1
MRKLMIAPSYLMYTYVVMPIYRNLKACACISDGKSNNKSHDMTHQSRQTTMRCEAIVDNNLLCKTSVGNLCTWTVPMQQTLLYILFVFPITMANNIGLSMFNHYCGNMSNTSSVISCNQAVSGTLHQTKHVCIKAFINQTASVTFSNCYSQYTSKLYVFDADKHWISQRYCENGINCNPGACVNQHRAVFSIPNLNANEYLLAIEQSYGPENQTYQLDIQCIVQDMTDMCIIEPSIVHHYTLQQLLHRGWSVCYFQWYTHYTSLSYLQSRCPTGGNYYLFIGAIDLYAETGEIYVGAFGPGSVLSNYTLSQKKAYKPLIFSNDSNYKVYWYNYPLHSFGFAPSEHVRLNAADMWDANNEDRLSWRMDGNRAGFRAGSYELMFSQYKQEWHKLVLYKHCTDVLTNDTMSQYYETGYDTPLIANWSFLDYIEDLIIVKDAAFNNTKFIPPVAVWNATLFLIGVNHIHYCAFGNLFGHEYTWNHVQYSNYNINHSWRAPDHYQYQSSLYMHIFKEYTLIHINLNHPYEATMIEIPVTDTIVYEPQFYCIVAT